MTAPTPIESVDPTVKAVFKAVGVSLRRFAYDMGFSPANAHALVTGERPVSKELAKEMAIKYGVHPLSFTHHHAVPYDCHGRPYSRESFEEHKRREPQELTDQELQKLLQPVVALLRGAARAGRLALVKQLLRNSVSGVIWQVDYLSGFVRAANAEASAPRRVYTYGELRANPSLAAAMDFVDLPEKADDEVAFQIEQRGRKQESKPIFDPELFPEVPNSLVELLDEPVRPTTTEEPTDDEMRAMGLLP